MVALSVFLGGCGSGSITGRSWLTLRSKQRFAPAKGIGGYYRADWRSHVIAIDAMGDLEDVQRMVLHEYLHTLLQRSGVVYPPWYEEGLAAFLSTATLESERVTLGIPPVGEGIGRIAQPRRLGPHAPTDTRSIAKQDAQGPVFAHEVSYERAWAQVHYIHMSGLFAQQQGRWMTESNWLTSLQAYLAGFEHSVDDTHAFERAFGIDWATFNRRVDAHLAGAMPLVTVTVTVPGGELAEVMRMSATEVAHQLGRLALDNQKHALAQAFFEHTLVRSPGDARALSGLALAMAGAAAEAESEAIATSTKAPEAWFEQALLHAERDPIPRLDYAGYLLGMAADMAVSADAKALLERARELAEEAISVAPDSAEAHALLGLSYALDDSGDALAGIRGLKRAAALLPGDDRIRLYLATLAVRVGAIDDARALLRLVLHAPHKGRVAKQAKALQQRLDKRTSY